MQIAGGGHRGNARTAAAMPPTHAVHAPAIADGRPTVFPAVSDDPHVRWRQSAAFWRRNPGYQEWLPFLESLRGLVRLLPGGAAIHEYTRATPHGYGQMMLDQMTWQIRSRRQPDNPWWMAMNARLVGDGLTAEAYLRAGRAHELTSPQHRAWLTYLILSDQAKAKRVQGGLLNALDGLFVLNPAARRAYWVAHDESIQASRNESYALLEQVARRFPEEAEFSSAWANTISLLRRINTMAASHAALLFQRLFLPPHQPSDHHVPSWLQQAFMGLIMLADSEYERRVESRLRPRRWA